jgi:hypothetical protein
MRRPSLQLPTVFIPCKVFSKNEVGEFDKQRALFFSSEIQVGELGILKPTPQYARTRQFCCGRNQLPLRSNAISVLSYTHWQTLQDSAVLV